MAEHKESEFHNCICSKLEKLTLAEELGQSWRSISVCISFGDYKKSFKIHKRDLPVRAEIGNVPGNEVNQVERNLEEPEEESEIQIVDVQSMAIPILPTTSNQLSNFNDQAIHVTSTEMSIKSEINETELDSELEPNVSPVPTHSASWTENRPKDETVSNKILTSMIQSKTDGFTTCSKQCSTTTHSLNLHQKTMHSDEQTKANWSYECDICSKKFLHTADLNRHKLVHTEQRTFQCTQCPKSFKRKDQMLRHLKTHQKNSAFRCSVCHKVLSSSRCLEVHTRTHTGEKPYQCQICEKLYRQPSNLNFHMQRAHSSYSYTTLN